MKDLVYHLPLMVSTGQVEHTELTTGFKTVKTFSSREGTVELVKSRREGQLRIIKSVRHENPRKPPHEAYMLSRLGRQHDNIVKLYAAELSSTGHGLMCFEYCSGGNIYDQCNKFDSMNMPVPILFALHIWVSMADALAFLHHGLKHVHGSTYRKVCDGLSIVHSDIKDDNVYLRFDSSNKSRAGPRSFVEWAAGASHALRKGKEDALPQIVLADFGMCVAAGEHFRGGCEAFLAPECKFTKGRRMNHKSDIYSMGVLMKSILDRESKCLWPILTDPKKAAIHIAYKGLGMTEVLRSMLAVNPAERGDFSGTKGCGLLSQISKFRKERDRLIDAGAQINPNHWVSKP